MTSFAQKRQKEKQYPRNKTALQVLFWTLEVNLTLSFRYQVAQDLQRMRVKVNFDNPSCQKNAK